MDIRYPTGRYQYPEDVTPATRAAWIEALGTAPQQLRDAIHGLSAEKLDTPYREQGWSPRQIVHHVADSHLHSYIRCKWTLTEDTPTIKAYSQNTWAETPDNRGPVEPSLDLQPASTAAGSTCSSGSPIETGSARSSTPSPDARSRSNGISAYTPGTAGIMQRRSRR